MKLNIAANELKNKNQRPRRCFAFKDRFSTGWHNEWTCILCCCCSMWEFVFFSSFHYLYRKMSVCILKLRFNTHVFSFHYKIYFLLFYFISICNGMVRSIKYNKRANKTKKTKRKRRDYNNIDEMHIESIRHTSNRE